MASLLQAIGVDMGEKLFAADKFNPKGYFEDLEFLQLQQEILKECTPEEDGWQDWGWTLSQKFDRTCWQTHRDRAREIVQTRQEKGVPWGWKDPRTTLLLDFWDELLPDAKYVFVYRFPWDVANSIVRLHRDPFEKNPDYALDIWDFYNRHLLEFYRQHGDRCLLVNINAAICNPIRLFEGIERKLGLEVGDRLNLSQFANICESKLLESLAWGSSPVKNLYLTSPQYFHRLSQLDRVADLPSLFSTDALAENEYDEVELRSSYEYHPPQIQSAIDIPPENIVVSVVIPCYNQGQYVLEAIASVQSCQDRVYEIIVVNDASSDPVTRQVLAYLREKGYTVIDSQTNRGLAEARNIGIRHAKGKYILPLDADNKIRGHYITRSIEVLDRYPQIGIVYGNAEFFGDKTGVWEVEEFDINSMAACNAIDACAVYRKAVWEDCGGYDPNIPDRLGYEDWDLWLGAAKRGWQFHHLHETVFDYRFRQTSMVSGCNVPENRKRLFEYICAKHIELYATNFAMLFADKEAEALAEKNKVEELYEKLQESYKQLDRDRIEIQKLADALDKRGDELQQSRQEGQKIYDEAVELHRKLDRANAERQQIYEDAQEVHKKLYKTEGKLLQREQQLAATQYEEHRAKAQFAQAREQLDEYHRLLEAAHQEHEQFKQSQLVQFQMQLQQAQLESAALRNHIAVMESTKFWKLRDLWFKLKSPFSAANAKLAALGSKIRYAFDLWRIKGLKFLLGKVFKKLSAKFDTTPPLPSDTVPQLKCNQEPYRLWLNEHYPRQEDLRKMAETVSALSYQPKISIVVPVYNPPEQYLREAIESVMQQVYPNWELCLADDASSAPHVKPILEEYAAKDSRIKVVFRQENGHISRSSNSALEVATGEYVSLLDHDDLLTPDALYEVVLLLNRHPEADMIYSDEDKIDENEFHKDPFFKPQWCPDSFLSRMYTCHLGTYRRSLLEKIGGFRVGFEGSQDYDLVLRFTEQTDKIFHIPKVLYHWRIHLSSAASGSEAKPYAYEAGKKAITEAIFRRGEPGEVRDVPNYLGHYIIRYQLQQRDRVSIIIPTRDLGDVLDRCLSSIFTKTDYPDYEVIVVDNGSQEDKTLRILDKWRDKEPERFSCHRLDIPFNFSKLNNYAVGKTEGKYLLFLNNDTEVKKADWLTAMVEQAQRPSVGAVGTLLLYPDDTIQHAGVIMGIGGIGAHSHKYFPGVTPGYFGHVIGINNVTAVTAACLMCRRQVFAEVGGFDEQLTVAYNDIDLCLKMLEKGYRNIYIPHAVLYHHESKSRGYEDTVAKQARWTKEARIIHDRWQKYIEDDPCYSPHLTRDREDYTIRVRS